MQRFMRGFLAFLVGLNFIFICQCTKDSRLDIDKIYSTHPWISASDTVVIRNREYTMSGRAFRLGPGGPRQARHIGLIVMLSAAPVVQHDFAESPYEIHADSMWIADKDSCWAKELEKLNTFGGGHSPSLSLMINDGPEWSPGDTINIVVRLIAGDSAVYLEAPNLEITQRKGGR